MTPERKQLQRTLNQVAALKKTLNEFDQTVLKLRDEIMTARAMTANDWRDSLPQILLEIHNHLIDESDKFRSATH